LIVRCWNFWKAGDLIGLPDGDLVGLNNFLGVKIFGVVMMLFLWGLVVSFFVDENSFRGLQKLNKRNQYFTDQEKRSSNLPNNIQLNILECLQLVRCSWILIGQTLHLEFLSLQSLPFQLIHSIQTTLKLI
jgi:hypothetical protein